MLAAVTEQIGRPPVVRTIEPPALTPTEVLVKVQAAGVNPVDWKINGGIFPSGALGAAPFVQGWDVTGVVVEAPRVTRFRPGDEVLGLISFPRPGGAFAEYVAAPARQFVARPAGMDIAAAAALPMAGLTAWQMLVDTAGISRGSRVLITAAAGGVGHLAVQIAHALGAHVTATASTAKLDVVRAWGADEIVDYTAVNVSRTVTGQDVVLDLLGGEHTVTLLDTLRRGGLLIQAIGPARPEVQSRADDLDVRVLPFLVEPDGHGLQLVLDLCRTRGIAPRVSRQFGLHEVGDAFEHGRTNRTTGKLIVTMPDAPLPDAPRPDAASADTTESSG